MTARLPDHLDLIAAAPGGIRKLRGLILELAVRGKLVQQDPNDEPASELLRRIARERARLEAEGVCKRSKAMPPVSADEQPFAMPEGWAWASIEQLADVVRGGSPRPAGDPRYFGGPVPWITVGPITADESDYLHRVPEGLTLEGKERSRYIEPHTLLLTNSGATLGVPKISLIGGCINDGVAALLDVDYPLKLYLVNFLRTKTMSLRRINQGAAQPNLNTSIIKAMVVPLPPSEEQHRIVAEVDRLLSIAREAEAEVETNLKRAQSLRQAILSNAFMADHGMPQI